MQPEHLTSPLVSQIDRQITDVFERYADLATRAPLALAIVDAQVAIARAASGGFHTDPRVDDRIKAFDRATPVLVNWLRRSDSVAARTVTELISQMPLLSILVTRASVIDGPTSPSTFHAAMDHLESGAAASGIPVQIDATFVPDLTDAKGGIDYFNT